MNSIAQASAIFMPELHLYCYKWQDNAYILVQHYFPKMRDIFKFDVMSDMQSHVTMCDCMFMIGLEFVQGLRRQNGED